MTKINKKIFLLLVVIVTAIIFSLTALSGTYAKYASNVSGTADMNIAKFSNKWSVTTQNAQIDIFGTANFDFLKDTTNTKFQKFTIQVEDASDVGVVITPTLMEANIHSVIPTAYVITVDAVDIKLFISIEI